MTRRSCSQAGQLAVHSPIAPCWVLGGEAHREAADLRPEGRSAAFGRVGLGPVAGDRSTVPTDHGCWLHDQEHVVQTAAGEHGRKHGEDCPIDFSEPRSSNLALQDQDLVAEGEDLGVTRIAGGEQPTQPGDQQSDERRKWIHRPATVLIASPQTPRTAARMNS